MKNLWNKLLIFLRIRKPQTQEWDEDHALDMIMNSMINELSEEEIKEIFEDNDD